MRIFEAHHCRTVRHDLQWHGNLMVKQQLEQSLRRIKKWRLNPLCTHPWDWLLGNQPTIAESILGAIGKTQMPYHKGKSATFVCRWATFFKQSQWILQNKFSSSHEAGTLRPIAFGTDSLASRISATVPTQQKKQSFRTAVSLSNGELVFVWE